MRENKVLIKDKGKSWACRCLKLCKTGDVLQVRASAQKIELKIISIQFKFNQTSEDGECLHSC